MCRLATALLIAALALPASAQVSDAPSLAPPNPSFVDYLHGVSAQGRWEDNHPAGLVPEPIDLSMTNGLAISAIRPQATIPASYDLRALGKLTPVRNQGSCGSCWDFAAMGSLESSLMPAEAWDFSENNLKNLAGFDIPCCSGGNRTMACAYFARWGGPVSEDDDPYNPSSCSSPSGRVARKHVQEVIYIPNRTSALDNTNIKQAVMDYGAVYTTYYHSNYYYKSSTAGYYFNSSSQANHAVCIVGWDDSYSRGNFNTAPPGDGAFLVRNSWGAYWGISGYFWMSYYDTSLGKNENAAFLAETNAFDGIYQYDHLGWTSNTGYGSSTAWFANVFTATSNTSVVAASWYSAAPNSTYELRVYLNPSSGPLGPGPAAAKTGTLQFAGYHTVGLDSPVAVAAGQKFSVVVRITTPGYSYPIPLEKPYSGFCSAARANAGQSYISSSGTSWGDVTSYYANTNVCLKAFTTASSGPAPAALSVTPANGLAASGTAGGPFSPSSQTYTLTNSGGAALSWTVSSSQPWTSVSASGGTLAAGASTTVTVTVNPTAGSLPAGSYSDSVVFTNATNGNGSTSRSVSLSVTPQQQGTLSVSPATGFGASGLVGGPFSPSSESYTLTNIGGASINWTAGKSQQWSAVSPASGSLAAGASAVVTVSVNAAYAAALAAGQYSDTLTFANTTNGLGNTTRSLSLTVNASTPPPPGGEYRVVPAAFSWIDAAGHTKLTLGNDATSAAVVMPFNFTFYGKVYNRLYVGSNGLLGFNSTTMYTFVNGSLPAVAYPNAAIYPYWDNLNPALGGSVTVGTAGAAPSRKMVVSWTDVPHFYSSQVKLSVQAILEEATGDIVFQYLNVTPANLTYGAGKSATIGIENETGSKAVLYSYNQSSVSNGSAIRFTTLPGSVARQRTILW